MKRRRLGQHQLVDPNVLNIILDCAEFRENDVVFEIGAGSGELTERLCKVATKVIAAEIDPALYHRAKQRLSHLTNLKLINMDGFKFTGHFDLLISNLPYSESSHFIEWLATKKFRRAVVMLQREFVDKLTSKPGRRNYRAISALAQAVFHLKEIANLGRSAFRPQPKVKSTLLVIEPKLQVPTTLDIQRALKKLFSFRGRILSAALRHLTNHPGLRQTSYLLKRLSKELMSKRIENLTPPEALLVAKALEKTYEHR